MELTRIHQLARALDYSEFETEVMKEQAAEPLETEASDICHSISVCYSADECEKHAAESVFTYIMNEYDMKLPFNEWIKTTKGYSFRKDFNKR